MKSALYIRIVIGGVFLSCDILSHWVSSTLGLNSMYYWAYYLVCGVMDAFIVACLFYASDSKWVVQLMVINFIGVVFNIYGAVIWFLYLAPESYNIIIYVLAALQWVRLLWVSSDDKTPIGGNYNTKLRSNICTINFDLLSKYRAKN